MSDKESFAYSEEYQAKVLAYMLADAEFCNAVKPYLDQTQFANKALQWFFKALTEPENHPTCVTIKEDLVVAANNNHIKEDEVQKYVDLFSLISKPPLPAEKEHIVNTIDKFIKTQEVKKILLASFDLMENNQWDEITDSMTKACQSGIHLNDQGHFYFKDLKERILRRLDADVSFKIATGIPKLDSYLNGGIKAKQLGLIAGGTGRGKSVFLQWLAKTAVFLGKKVVYFTLEMPADDIASRLDSSLSHIRFSDINVYSNEVFAALSPYVEKYGDRLVIKEYEADSATVGTLRSFLSQLSAQGFVPDLVIVDYLDLLKPHRRYKDQTQELDAITKALHGMAKGLNIVVWTATQLNRSGIVMETPDETAIAGAIAKLFTCDISLFLAQTKEERIDEIMRILVIKSRNGVPGRTIKLTTDFSFMTFYSDRGELLDDDDETND